MRIAILGSGLTACSLISTLTTLLPPNLRPSITLYDGGRRPGGRASTRGTRGAEFVKIDHGVMGFSVGVGSDARTVLEGALDAAPGVVVESGIGGTEVREDRISYLPGPEGMGGVCSALLAQGTGVTTKFGEVVTGVSRTVPGKFTVTTNKGDVGEFDLVVCTSATPAHKRWSDVYGGVPPMVQYGGAAGSAVLTGVLERIGRVVMVPVIATFFVKPGKEREVVPEIEGTGEVLERVRAKVLRDGSVAVVALSTPEYARSSARSEVYGKTSAAAGFGSTDGKMTCTVVKTAAVRRPRLFDDHSCSTSTYSPPLVANSSLQEPPRTQSYSPWSQPCQHWGLARAPPASRTFTARSCTAGARRTRRRGAR